MARIRSIKPELRTSLTAAEWPREVRYFWVLLWGYLDDHGYGVDEPRIIKGDCFPMDDDLTAADIDKWLDIFANSGSLCRFQGPDGRRYLHAPKWAEHQRPQHPAMPRFPSCVLSHETVMNGFHETRGSVSGESHESFGQPGELPGQSSNGESHETLTPEGFKEQGAGSREQGAGTARARTRAASTLLGNSLLEQHKRQVRPSLPREVVRRTGEQIDLLLDDPEITADEIKEALARLRANPKLGPGVLPSLVNEVRQEAAHPELARRRGRASPRHQGFQNPESDAAFEGSL